MPERGVGAEFRARGTMVKILIIDEILKAQAGGGEGGASAPSESRCKGQLLKFLMPGDKQKRLFLLQDSILYELQQPCMGGKTSWFMDNEVVQDGSFYLATPFQVCCVHFLETKMLCVHKQACLSVNPSSSHPPLRRRPWKCTIFCFLFVVCVGNLFAAPLAGSRFHALHQC